MSDSAKEVEKIMKKDAAFICADVWSDVFRLLPPYLLGLRLALVNHRFDALVDGHLATRKWTFGDLEIRGKIGENGTTEVEIRKLINPTTWAWKVLPIPDEDIPLPANVVGFECISICYFDSHLMPFLRQICPHFSPSVCGAAGMNLLFHFSSHFLLPSSSGDQMMAFICDNIWLAVKEHCCTMCFSDDFLEKLSKSTLLVDIHFNCPSLKLVNFPLAKLFSADGDDDDDNSANAKPVAKWLFTARADGTPKVFKHCLLVGRFSAEIEAIKLAFSNASSPSKFIIVIWTLQTVPIVPFALSNGLTGEQLTLKQWDGIDYAKMWLLVRCPIARDETQWAKWEEEAIGWRCNKQWNRLIISSDRISDERRRLDGDGTNSEID